MEKIENLILKNLIYNDEYVRKVIPFIKKEYFKNNSEKILFGEIDNFVNQYKVLPSYESLVINLKDKRDITSEDLKECMDLLKDFSDSKISTQNQQWLIDNTEKFCQDRAIYNAIRDSVSILDGRGNHQKGEIPKILSDALAVCFDNNVGHDYLQNYEERYDFYHQEVSRIPFDLDIFNKITNGGLPKKTLNIALAGTGVGKSLFMCHCAASFITSGYNVLYITMEMAEERIAERIDANLLNVRLDQLQTMTKQEYTRKFNHLKNKANGSIIIKEYPTASASVLHFRALLNDLKLKKNFTPDIIFVDYLNICCSSRLKHGSNVNSYSYVKAIAEELRGLAVEYNVPVFSATQTTRSGFTSSDPGLEDTSESFGLPATADFMFALVSNEELEKMNQIMVKQLKNRYNDPNYYKRFFVGIDKPKMKLYDVEEGAQKDITDAGHNSKDDNDPFSKLQGMFGDGEKFNNLKV